MLVAIPLGMHASVYFVFGIFISIYIFCHDLCHAILEKNIYIYIYICFLAFFLCYMGVQICGNSNVENKMRDISKGTYLAVRNSGNGETYDTATS